jgi:hypothetical protein
MNIDESSSSSSLASDRVQFDVAFDNVMMAFTLESDVNTSSGDDDDELGVDDDNIDDYDELNQQTSLVAGNLKHNFSDKEMYYLLRGVTKMGVESWSQIYEYYKNKFDSDKTPNDLQTRYEQMKNSKYSKLLYKHIFQ